MHQELATLHKKHSTDKMMTVDAQASLKNDSSEDEDFNNIDSLIMDDAIKQETDSSDDEMVWQSGQDDHGILVDTNNQINTLIYNLFICDKPAFLNTFTKGNDSKDNKVYHSLDKCLNQSLKKKLFSIANLIWGQPPTKKPKTQDLKPITFVKFNTRVRKPKTSTIQALFDSGGSGSLISQNMLLS